MKTFPRLLQKFIFKLALIFLGIVLAAAVLTTLDRILSIYLDKYGYFKAMKPNLTLIYNFGEFSTTAKISSQGIRNEEVEIPKPKNRYRLLAVGDSFTYGWGVELKDSWVKLLESSLKKEGRDVEIINAGIPGGNLTEDRRTCLAYKDQFQVDGIIIGLFEDDLYQALIRQIELSDFQDFIWSGWPTLIRLSKRFEEEFATKYIQEGSVIDVRAVLKDELKDDLKAHPLTLNKIDPEIRDDFLNVKFHPIIVAKAMNDPNSLTFILNQKQLDFAMQVVDKRLKRFKERCIKDLPTLIVFIPSNEIVSDYYHPFKKQLAYHVEEGLTTIDLETPLKEKVERYGFKFISPLAQFRADGCRDCYYPYDGHFTKVGNQRLADFAFPYLFALLPK